VGSRIPGTGASLSAKRRRSPAAKEPAPRESAFTSTCSNDHLPGYVKWADDIRAKVACVAVNDIFVMNAWTNARVVNYKVLMLADGNGDFKAMGRELDSRAFAWESTRSATPPSSRMACSRPCTSGGEMKESGAGK